MRESKIREYLETFNYSMSGESEYIIGCTFSEDSKRQLFFNAEKGVGHCKKCRETPGIIRLVAKLEGISIREAIAKFRGEIIELSSFDSLTEDLEEMFVKPIENIDTEVHDELPEHYEAFTNKFSLPGWVDIRGLDFEFLKSYGFGYCHNGRYSKRIIIPIHTFSEKTFIARSCSGAKGPKYLNAPKKEGSGISRFIYNINNCCMSGTILIAEGAFDVLRLVSYGYINSVALMGKVVSKRQLEILSDINVRRVVIMLDPDAAVDAIRNASIISNIADVYMAIPEEKDPCDMSSDEVRTVIKDAERFDPIEVGFVDLNKLLEGL